MRTKKEIKEHLLNVGYTSVALAKIMGFLIGKGIKSKDETFTVLIGKHTFDYFFDWWNSEIECTSIIDILDAFEKVIDEIEKINKNRK